MKEKRFNYINNKKLINNIDRIIINPKKIENSIITNKN